MQARFCSSQIDHSAQTKLDYTDGDTHVMLGFGRTRVPIARRRTHSPLALLIHTTNGEITLMPNRIGSV